MIKKIIESFKKMETMEKKNHLYLIFLLIIAPILIWYIAQFIRTGHFWNYINPPSFTFVEPNSEVLFNNLRSYQSINSVRDTFLKEGYILELEDARIDGSFKGRILFSNVFVINNYRVHNVIYPLRLIFYNNRLAQVSICSPRAAEEIMDLIKNKYKIEVRHGSHLVFNNLLVQYAFSKNHCVYFDDMRLSEEISMFIDLTQ